MGRVESLFRLHNGRGTGHDLGMGWRGKFRIVLAGISTPFVVVLYLNIETLAQSWGWDSLLVEAAQASAKPSFWERVMDFLVSPIMALVSVALLAFTAGVWVDALLRRLARTAPPAPAPDTRYENLGRGCETAYTRINSWLHPLYADGPRTVSASIGAPLYSFLLTLQKAGIVAPVGVDMTDPKIVGQIGDYLKLVGSLLVAGHIDEAKDAADHMTDSIKELDARLSRR